MNGIWAWDGCLSYLGVQSMYPAPQNNDSNGNNKRYFETG